jgi:hypothetical protein
VFVPRSPRPFASSKHLSGRIPNRHFLLVLAIVCNVIYSPQWTRGGERNCLRSATIYSQHTDNYTSTFFEITLTNRNSPSTSVTVRRYPQSIHNYIHACTWKNINKYAEIILTISLNNYCLKISSNRFIKQSNTV